MRERCVVDTSALQYLFRIGQLDILQTLFKEQNLIPKIAPSLEQLIDAGMWISIEIKRYALELSGEGN